MNMIIKQTRVMEPETIEKNGTILESRMSKGKIIIFGVLLLVFCGFTNKAVGQSWSLSNGTLTVSDNSAFSNYPYYPYPWADRTNEITKLSIGSGVTSIPASAFNGYSNLKTVTIADGTIALRFIGQNFAGHFQNSPIETLYLGRNLETEFISGDYSNGNPFSENSALKSVTIGNNVTVINDNSFQDCTGLQSLIMSSALISIGNNAFHNCSNLSSELAIPQGVKTIGYGAFQGCRILPSVTIPNSVTSIGYGAFNNCLNLKTVTIADGTVALRFIGQNFAGHFQNSPIETLYLGRNLETEYINGDYSDGYPFSENSALKSVTVGNNVTAINDNSFQDCTGLQSLIMSNTLISIGSNAFLNCSNLSSTLAIPQGVKTIGYGAFQGCRILPSVTIPNSVTSIGYGAFNNCLNLKTVTIADGTVALRFIGQNFAGHFQNSPIETLYLGRNLETEYINGDYSDGYPFSENSILKSVTIGNDVTFVNDYSFSNCTGLTQITSNATKPPTIYSNTFYNVSRSIPICVPCDNINDYKKAQYWSEFTNYQCGGGCFTAINEIKKIENKIYPNPAKDEVFINSDLPIKKVEIYSLTGALLLSDNDFNGKITVSTLLKGIYLVKVYTDKCLTISKIVKE